MKRVSIRLGLTAASAMAIAVASHAWAGATSRPAATKCQCEKGGKGCICKKGECTCANCSSGKAAAVPPKDVTGPASQRSRSRPG